jgi:hypothetical protein
MRRSWLSKNACREAEFPSLDEQNHNQHEADPCGYSQERKFIGHCVSPSASAEHGAMGYDESSPS